MPASTSCSLPVSEAVGGILSFEMSRNLIAAKYVFIDDQARPLLAKCVA